MNIAVVYEEVEDVDKGKFENSGRPAMTPLLTALVACGRLLQELCGATSGATSCYGLLLLLLDNPLEKGGSGLCDGIKSLDRRLCFCLGHGSYNK